MLGADALTLSAWRRGFRPTLVREESIALHARPGAAPWQAAIEALPVALAPSLAERPEVTVILSNHFVRYALLPWNDTLKTAQEWTDLARHRLSAIHGDAVNGWLVRVAETHPQGPRIVSAIDKGLLEALDDQLCGSGVMLKSVQPYLTTAFNQAQKEIARESCWFVIEDSGCLTVSLLLDGRWYAIRSGWVDERWTDSLPDILERKAAMLALQQPCNRAIVCTRQYVDAARHASLRLQTLDFTKLAMALS